MLLALPTWVLRIKTYVPGKLFKKELKTSACTGNDQSTLYDIGYDTVPKPEHDASGCRLKRTSLQPGQRLYLVCK